MSIWEKYKVNELPEEHRADVIKVIVQETEATVRANAKEVQTTKRTKIQEFHKDGDHQVIHGMAVLFLFAIVLTISIAGYYAFEVWVSHKYQIK